MERARVRDARRTSSTFNRSLLLLTYVLATLNVNTRATLRVLSPGSRETSSTVPRSASINARTYAVKEWPNLNARVLYEGRRRVLRRDARPRWPFEEEKSTET